MAAERVETQGQRRKIQNRINQRARRLRMRDAGDVGKAASQNQYQIECWRLDEHKNTRVQIETSLDLSPRLRNRQQDHSQDDSNSNRFPITKLEIDTLKCDNIMSATQLFHLKLSPFQDHLLNLIQFNVLRAIFSNKSTLMSSAAYFKTVNISDKPQIERIQDCYPTRAIVVSASSGIPVSLLPTQLQATVEHSTWIDLIPFPRMRDNLIKPKAEYDPVELARDLIGDLVDFASAYDLSRPSDTDDVENTLDLSKRENETTASRNGLVIWGEPHCPENWEVTPGFLEKWRWTLEGCQDVLDSSNRWRLLRDEEPLTTID
ncbi:hypothetical protein V501_01715 [Pseudogymnoascus sp. VKM F-4519 (FW-2642)]|nr:hypothetical protein V501_01715 [Pseudogymnoascus sp. VKM F-4519 (FW-2642)]